MFKQFSVEDHVSSISQIKNSAQRSIIASIITLYPSIEPHIDNILPKKSMLLAKAQDGMQLIVVNNEVLFFNPRDAPFFPTLRLLHKYPSMMQRMQVDRGAVKFVLGGANIMCPGLTSAGGSMPASLPVGTPVAIYVEGKFHAMAIGITKMPTEDIRKINRGIGVESFHYLLDQLWQLKSI
jgi:PUA domain protein